MKKEETLLKKYKVVKPIYEEYSEKIKALIEELMNGAGLNVHSVCHRTKAFDKLAEKISRPGKSYKDIAEITDLSGIRVICYFADQVDKVAGIIKKNFIVLPKFSVDKRELLDPDRFGYLSLHLVVKLSGQRSKLPEYKKYENLFCEIQIRSILQHAWNEIEHDLGYKSAVGIPKNLRRRFCRLAGLLELADDEFNDIKKKTKEYSKKVSKQITTSPQNVKIDNISLSSYITESTIIKKIDNGIAKLMGGAKIEANKHINKDVEMLAYFDILNISQLNDKLNKNNKQILEFARKWMGGTKHNSTVKGISLFYLCYLLIGSTKNKKRILKYLNHFSIGSIPKRNEITERVMRVTENVQKTAS